MPQCLSAIAPRPMADQGFGRSATALPAAIADIGKTGAMPAATTASAK